VQIGFVPAGMMLKESALRKVSLHKKAAQEVGDTYFSFCVVMNGSLLGGMYARNGWEEPI
jgi:hypothetical protein